VAKVAPFPVTHAEEPEVVAPWSEEQRLLSAVRAGDRAAAEEMVERTYSAVYASLYRLCGDGDLAADLTQETYQKAWAALKGFDGRSQLFTWLYRIAVNRTLNHLKQRKFRDGKHAMSLNDLDVETEHHPDLVALVSDKTPRRDAALGELKEKLNAARQRLSENHRIVVTLHDVQGLSHEEIANIMDCNVGTVRSRLFYARQQLQAYLSDYIK